ncbi:MAG: DUF1499 domain-containing protein [Rhodobacteraceae bacterium]|jgi:hypothetical protein|nr:DUF1499 domain-containing protein [Paracoccaceae bacterium]
MGSLPKVMLAALVLAVAGAALWVRLAPADPADWHRPTALRDPGDERGAGSFAATRLLGERSGTEVLAALDAAALATPRTRRLAGSPEEGIVTWVTRSALWGFPDYTTAWVQADSFTVYGRLRFGRSDFGVNEARVRAWLVGIGADPPGQSR